MADSMELILKDAMKLLDNMETAVDAMDEPIKRLGMRVNVLTWDIMMKEKELNLEKKKLDVKNAELWIERTIREGELEARRLEAKIHYLEMCSNSGKAPQV